MCIFVLYLKLKDMKNTEKVKLLGMVLIGIGIIKWVTTVELHDAGNSIVEERFFNLFTWSGIAVLMVYLILKLTKNGNPPK